MVKWILNKKTKIAFNVDKFSHIYVVKNEKNQWSLVGVSKAAYQNGDDIEFCLGAGFRSAEAAASVLMDIFGNGIVSIVE